MKKRIISGIMMCFFVFPLVFIGGKYFQVFISLISLLALKEILDLRNHHAVLPRGVVLICFVGLVFLVFPFLKLGPIVTGFDLRNISIVILSLFLPCLFYKREEFTTKDALYLCGTIFFLGFSFHTLLLIREKNLMVFFYVGLIPILSDIFAMLFGKMLGKHPCALKISPNKTWEGSIGGAFVSILFCSVFYIKWIGDLSFIKVLIFTTFLTSLGQLGDLFFSKIKRENDKKDFSQIIPGHGGLLDRLDSLLFVILTYSVLFGLY